MEKYRCNIWANVVQKKCTFYIELDVLFFFGRGSSRFGVLVDLRGMGDKCDKGVLYEIPKIQ